MVGRPKSGLTVSAMVSFEKTVSSDPANLAPVRKEVEAFLATAGIADAGIANVGLCLNEAMANIIRHAYRGAEDRPIKVGAAVENGRVTITLRDWGNGRDPSTCCGNNDPLTPGGLGLNCLRRLMDEVTFTPQPDGMLLTLSCNGARCAASTNQS